MTFEESGERHRRELTLRERLREAAPHRGALRRFLAEQERVKEPEAIGIGELPERLSGVLVLGILAADEEPRVAGEQVEVELDGHAAHLRDGRTATRR
ncbi:MAG: hypothetical protein E6I57_05345 [Chloroflexi bacterium]|nr:MAG: hypothetical protein E6J24_13610 [Chloroflexota bacterium]TME40470.1 MAG: hypothetical protein E6I57_05345 [Chloroflexota bacterium]